MAKLSLKRRATKELGGEEFCLDCVINKNNCLRLDILEDPKLLYSTTSDRWIYLKKHRNEEIVVPYEIGFVKDFDPIKLKVMIPPRNKEQIYFLSPHTGNFSKPSYGQDVSSYEEQKITEALVDSIYGAYSDLHSLPRGIAVAELIAYRITNPQSQKNN